MARKYKKSRDKKPLYLAAGIGVAVLVAGGAGAAFFIMRGDGDAIPANADPAAVGIIKQKNAVQADPDNAAKRLALGRLYLESGQGAAAVKELETARRLGDDSDEVAILLARAHYLAGENDDVLGVLQDRSFAPEYQEDSLVLRGKALLSSGQTEEADEAFGEAEERNPQSVEARLGQAQILARNGEVDRADGILDQILEQNPEHLDTLLLKGEITRQKGDLEGSTEYFTSVLALEPRQLPARLARIDNLLNLEKYDEARVDLDFMERAGPGNPLVSYLWAKYYARTGDIETASSRLQQAERVLPDHMPTVYLRAVIAYSQNNLEQAHHNLQRVLEVAPRDVGARRLMAATLLRQGESGQAIPILNSLVKDGVTDSNIYSLLGRAQMETGNYAAATENFDAAVNTATDPSSVKTQRALSKLAQGAEEEALADLQSIVDQEEDSMQARVLLVLLALRDRDYARALSEADALAQQFPENPMAENLRGAALIGLDRLDDAHAAFSAALERDPDYEPAVIYLARLETQTGDLDSALERYNNLLARNPDNVNALVDISNIKLGQGDQDGAIDYLERAIRARPDVTGPGLRLVNLYISLNAPAKALSEANVLLQNHRDDPQVLEMVGRAQLAAGETANGIQTFRRLTNMLPESGPAQFLLGVALRQNDDTEAAKEAFRKAIDLTPAFAPSYQSLVSLEAESGNLEGALELAEGLRESMPDSPVGDVFAGDILLRRNNPEQAIDAFNAAWSKTPQFPVAVRLYRAHNALGDPEPGLDLMQQWVDSNPEDQEARKFLAATYLESGRYQQAIASYEEFLGPDSEDFVALNNLAWLYQQVGDPRDVETARSAYELKPDIAAVADTYGWILLSRGEQEEALPVLQKAAALAPANADIRYHFAKALAENGKRDQALREAESILSLNGGRDTMQQVQDLIDGLK